MSSAISCVVIKTDPITRSRPAVGKVVQVDGEPGLFVVVDVDRERNMAQLMEKAGKHRLTDVPFEFIRPLNRNLAQTIRNFLEARDEAKRRRHR